MRAGRGKGPMFTHCSSFINHFIKYVDEHLLFDRLQAGGAVVTVWCTAENRVNKSAESSWILFISFLMLKALSAGW